MNEQQQQQELEQIAEQIHEQIRRVNGRRSVRIGHYGYAIQALRETFLQADRFGWTFPNGMVTSSRYGWSNPVATRVAAIGLLDGTRRVQLAIWEGSGTISKPTYADALRGTIFMSREQAQALIDAWTVAGNPLDQAEIINLRSLRPVTVTISDSIRAGNCQHETRHFARLFPGRESVTAGELLDVLDQHAKKQHLAFYVYRAIRYAAAKAQQQTPQPEGSTT